MNTGRQAIPDSGIAEASKARHRRIAATWKAVWLKDEKKPCDTEATIAKLVASEMAVKNVDMGFQIHGGYGFMKEYPISRLYRNVKILTIGEGTSEVCRIVISRALGC